MTERLTRIEMIRLGLYIHKLILGLPFFFFLEEKCGMSLILSSVTVLMVCEVLNPT